MLTASRLIGALAFAVFGTYLAFITVKYFDEGAAPSYWIGLAAFAGFWAGWSVVGPRTGRGYSSSVGVSLTGVVALGFWVIFLHSVYEMVQKSMRRAYEGPADALVGVLEIGGEYALRFANLEVLATLVAGGLIAGMFTEFFARRYR